MAKVGRMVKELMVQELTSTLKARPNFFVASVGGLQAVEADTLRKKLHTMQARMLMLKRTLAVYGTKTLPLNGAGSELFGGSVGLVFPGEDFIPVAKLLADFAKDRQEKIVIRGGFVDGQLLDRGAFEHLAKLPSKPQLIAELIGVLESPITDLILSLEGALGDLPWVIEEASKSRKLENPDEPPAAAVAPKPTTPDAPTDAGAASPPVA